MQFKKFGSSRNVRLFTRGKNLIFVKILNEFKKDILCTIKEFEKEKAINMLTTIKNFQKGLLTSTEIHMFVMDILELLQQNFFIDYNNLRLAMNQNLCKEYLYDNFATWWYQSLYFMREAGYIKNINEYCQTFLNISGNIYTEEEVSHILQKSFNIANVPHIFPKDELKKLEIVYT